MQHQIGVSREENAVVLRGHRHWLQLLHPPYVQARELHSRWERRAAAGGEWVGEGRGSGLVKAEARMRWRQAERPGAGLGTAVWGRGGAPLEVKRRGVKGEGVHSLPLGDG